MRACMYVLSALPHSQAKLLLATPAAACMQWVLATHAAQLGALGRLSSFGTVPPGVSARWVNSWVAQPITNGDLGVDMFFTRERPPLVAVAPEVQQAPCMRMSAQHLRWCSRRAVSAMHAAAEWACTPLPHARTAVSGVLIATMWLREVKKNAGRFSYVRFAARRWMRLAPMLVVGMLTHLLVGHLDGSYRLRLNAVRGGGLK